MSLSGGVDDGFNHIHSTLIGASDDILGRIAYSFYKQQKVEFLHAFRTEHGRAPSDAELQVFYVTANSPASISSYLTNAEALSRDFVSAVLAEDLKELKHRSDQELNKIVRSFRPNFWLGVAQNLFSSVLFALLIGVMVFTAWSSKFGASHVIEQVMGVEFRGNAPSPRVPVQEPAPARRDP